MPTGYTAAIQDGTLTDFKEFAARCLRHLGVCISMRDEPWDAPIPERFEPSNYNLKQYEKYKLELENFNKKTASELEIQWKEELENTRLYNLKEQEKTKLYRERYEAMLAKVEAWQVPEKSEVIGAKRFMLEQLRDSIAWDCGRDDSSYEESSPSTFQEWKDAKLKSLEWSVNYHKKEYDLEIKRTNARNAFLKEFRNLLENV